MGRCTSRAHCTAARRPTGGIVAGGSGGGSAAAGTAFDAAADGTAHFAEKDGSRDGAAVRAVCAAAGPRDALGISAAGSRGGTVRTARAVRGKAARPAFIARL